MTSIRVSHSDPYPPTHTPHSTPDASAGGTPGVSPARRLPQETKLEAQRIKREKAAERRESRTDRAGIVSSVNALFTTSTGTYVKSLPHTSSCRTHAHAHACYPTTQSPIAAARRIPGDSTCTPYERTRHETLYEAARLRQQKHRQIVKQREKQELGNNMPGTGHASGGHGGEGDAAGGEPTDGYGTLAPGGVYGTNVGVLDMGFGVNG
jgi:hypothetical protein